MTNKNINPVILIFLLSFLYVFPLLLSNTLFADDLWRVWSGYPGFMENGRFMSEALMYLISSGYGVLDSSPLTQILAAFIYWCSGYLLSKKITPENSDLWHVIIGSSFLIGPFTVSQISFRFDSITISLSVFSAVLSYILYRGGLKSSFLCVILVLISLGFYQPSMFLVACLPFVCNAVINKSIEIKITIVNNVKFLLLVLLSFVCYKQLVMLFIPFGDYADKHSQVVSIKSESIAIIKNSLVAINNIFNDLLHSPDGFLYCLITISPLFFILVHGFVKKECTWSLALKLLSIVIVGLSLYFPMAVLKEPIVEPRVMSSACLLIFIFFTVASRIKASHFGVTVSVVIMMHFYIMMSIYSNTLSASFKHSISFSNSLSAALIESGWTQEDDVYFSGKLINPPPVLRFFDRFPYYKRVIQHYYVDSYVLGYRLSNIHGLKISHPGYYYMPNVSNEWKKLVVNNYGALYVNKGAFLFKFNE